MKKMLVLALMFSFAFAATAQSVDFDQGVDLGEFIENVGENLKKSETVPISENAGNIPDKTAVEMTDTGEEIVNRVQSEGKNSYEFMPNADIKWRFSCGDENSPSGRRWGFCWSYEFKPKVAGHNHEPDRLLTYINPDTGAPYSANIECHRDIPVGKPYDIKIKMPVFSSLVLEKTEWFGACDAVRNDDVAITVTAKNLIKLEELKEEPYFIFKRSSKYHPLNHFGTPDTNVKFKKIAWEYYRQFQPPAAGQIIITDMGLSWGGRYHSPALPPPGEEETVPNCWEDGQYHFYHRYGRQIDVRSWNIPIPNRKCFEEICCKYQVQPILEKGYGANKMNISLLEKDYSKASPFSKEADMLDLRAPHYHLNFYRPTDPPVNPMDDHRAVCPGITPAKSACPKNIYQ